MLDGLERNRIITGANTDRRGGVCPMIAADRNAFESGPMADIFAAVWDGYNGACILNRRDATERDLRVLKTMLETSLANSPELSSQLGQAWLDYHVGAEAATPGAGADFGAELTTALQQSSSLHDTGSFAPVASASASGPASAPARLVELVYDGGPLPAIAATTHAAAPAAPAAQLSAARVEPAAAAIDSPYEPYRIATPKQRAATTRASVDASSQSRTRAAQYAAQTTATAERAKARAVIANQAATLRGREWPRSAAQAGAPATPRGVAVEVPRHEVPSTPLEAPAIRQAAIPQLRTATPAAPAAPASRIGRPHESNDRTAELQGRTGWSWLPPFRSYDDYEEALENAGELEPGPRAVPEVQPPDEQRRPVRT
jgi:hypothetical protein